MVIPRQGSFTYHLHSILCMVLLSSDFGK